MTKVLVVFGTRPEAIKMAPVIHALQDSPFDVQICITAQHRDMLDQILDIFGIVPDFDLNLMRPGQDLYDITTGVLTGLRDILRSARPDLVLVHGDTTTSMAAALASFYEHIPVGHVEAGLRTNDLNAPWPEEGNRQLTARLTDFHFAPTQKSAENLIAENAKPEALIVTGNTVIDALYYMKRRLDSDEAWRNQLHAGIQQAGYDIDPARKYVLITAHRRENFGSGFRDLCTAIKTLAQNFPDIDFVYPVHLNPNVREPVNKILAGQDNIVLIEPLDYARFVLMLCHCHIVLTDSGGIQEEAPSLGKPVLVMRTKTERPEAVEAGTVKLVGTDIEQIVSHVSALLKDGAVYETMSRAHNPYGDGAAAPRIVSFLKEKLRSSKSES